MLCVSLVNYTNIGTLASTINVKHETNNIHRVIGGTLDIHSFFMTVIPTKMDFLKGKVKVEIAVAKGKQLHDKRQVKKTRDWNREKARILSKNNK